MHRVTLGGDRLRMRLPSRADSLEPARLAMLRHLASAGADAATVYRCELVLEELLLNIVRHALPHLSGAHLDLTVQVDAQRVVLSFEHAGPPFDPTAEPEPPRPTSIEQARPGQLGLLLVRRLSHHMAYRRDGDLNHVEVHVRRDEPGTAGA